MIVFLHIHKTAGSTFQFILENTFGVLACHSDHTKKKAFRQDDFAFARKFFPRMKSLAGHNLVDPMSLDLPGAFHITFLREPVARVFSHYYFSVRTGWLRSGLEENLRCNESLENHQVKQIAGERNLDKAKKYLERCQFVGLTERFDLSLRVLDKLSPYPLNLKYRRRRTAPKNEARSAARDPHMTELVREHNKLDLALYEFAFHEIFPEFCRRAGCQPNDQVASYEHYTSKWQWRYRLNNFYNHVIYRQACKLRR